jgi:hypothetical protein
MLEVTQRMSTAGPLRVTLAAPADQLDKIERGTIRGTKWRPTQALVEQGERLDVQKCAV